MLQLAYGQFYFILSPLFGLGDPNVLLRAFWWHLQYILKSLQALLYSE